MKSRLIREEDNIGNLTYWTEIDEQYIEDSTVYIPYDLNNSEAKAKVVEAFEKYYEIKHNKTINFLN